jgi:hypothetical protein
MMNYYYIRPRTRLAATQPATLLQIHTTLGLAVGWRAAPLEFMPIHPLSNSLFTLLFHIHALANCYDFLIKLLLYTEICTKQNWISVNEENFGVKFQISSIFTLGMF